MKKIFISFMCCFLAFCCFSGCAASFESNRIKTTVQKNKPNAEAVTDGLGDYLSFSAELFKAAGDGNSIVSPASLLTAFGMAFNGADGETLSEAEKTFGMSISELNEFCLALSSDISKLNDKGTVRIKTSNSLWIESSYKDYIKQEYVDEVAKYYDPEIFSLPFDNSAVKKINEWTSKNTDGMIKKLVEKLTDMRLALINALFVKGDWADKAENTFKNNFTCLDGKVTEGNFFGGNGGLYETENAYAIKRYLQCGAYYLGVLPKEAAYFADYCDNFNGDELNGLIKNKSTRKAIYTMPEFTAEFSYNLIPMLKSMGISRAFGENADFSKMTSSPYNLYIDEAVQKTFIEVNKSGLKAAAATFIGVKDSAELPIEEPLRLTFDRPFLYAICMPDGTPLFIGKQVEI